MESKDVAHPKTIPLLPIRPKRHPVSLHLDPSYQQHKRERSEGNNTATPSPSSAADSLSPATPLTSARPLSSSSETLDGDEEEKDPQSGPTRTAKSSKSSDSLTTREKRKRSRVTPEQLVHLEQLFMVDRCPTAARRREISEQLGMQERQTQIWFQNRRAKAKLQEGRAFVSPTMESPTPPTDPPTLSAAYEVDLHSLLHESELISIIPCTDLSIGTWRRIASTIGKHDLVAYICEPKRSLTWFIRSGGNGFKMELPFEIIINAEFTNTAPGSGLASFTLKQPPIFYLEQTASPRPDGTPVRYWKQCTDWTEGYQASHVLRHDILGSAVQLAHIVRNLQAGAASNTSLLPPPRSPLSSPTSPMELPAPPMAALTPYLSPSHSAADPGIGSESFPRGSLALTDPLSTSAFSQDTPHSAPTGAFPSSTFTTGLPTTAVYDGYVDYPGGDLSSVHGQVNDADDSVLRPASSRPYSAHPLQTTFYEEQRVSQVFKSVRRHSMTTPFGAFGTAPPILLTAPLNQPTESELSVSGVPSLLQQGSLIHDPNHQED